MKRKIKVEFFKKTIMKSKKEENQNHPLVPSCHVRELLPHEMRETPRSFKATRNTTKRTSYKRTQHK